MTENKKTVSYVLLPAVKIYIWDMVCLSVWEGLGLVIAALPGLFSYLFLVFHHCVFTFLTKLLSLKAPSKICSRWHSKKISFSWKISLEISCESSAWQMIHIKCQDLFSKKKKKIKSVVCCSCDWCFKG